MNPWLAILSGLVNLIAGWILAQFQISSCIARQLLGPRLRWDVEKCKGSEVRIELLDPAGQPTGQSAWYFRLLVTNDKRRVATCVRAYLRDVRKYHSTTPGYPSMGFFDAIPLIWAYRSPEPVEIPFGVTQYLDVVRLTLDSNGAIIDGPTLCISPLPTIYQNALKSGGKYALRILIQADHHIVEDIGMTFEWDGNTANPTVEVRPVRSFLGEFT